MPENQKRERQCREERQARRIRNRALLNSRQGAAIIAREKLGRRHMAGDRMRRIVQRQLVPKAPRKDTHPQDSQSYGESAQSWTLITQSGRLWDQHRNLLTMMPQGFDVLQTDR